jgi:hypothetical protein
MRGARRSALALAAALLLGTPAGPAGAADRPIVQGLLDTELWKTDSGSEFPGRNDGGAAGAGHLRLWAAGEPAPRLQLYVRALVSGGAASDEVTTGPEIELAFARVTLPEKVRLVIEAGRIQTPVGDFAPRYLSSANPLIGAPAGVGVTEVHGLKASGWAGLFDYTFAWVDAPISGSSYGTDGDTAWRPMLAAGVTPFTGFRVGAWITRGPYLDPGDAPVLPAGSGWRDYQQEVAGFETQFSRGYIDLHGQIARSMYEVPTIDAPARGSTWYVEPRYTFSPRLYAALRIGRNHFQEIEADGAGGWGTEDLVFADAEIGLGVRLAHGVLLKTSYRRDRWDVEEDLRDEYPDGWALAAQLSWSFDVLSLLDRPR